jgi:hypothetical protein
MKKEITTKTQGEVVVSDFEKEMLQNMEYSSTETKDLLIPKVLLMQGSSEFIKEGADCKVGDLVRSQTAEVYGSVREKDYKPVKFIPIFMYKTWVKQERLPNVNGGNDKLQWVETYAVTPENSNQKWEQEEVIDGHTRKFKLIKNINFYALLEKDFNNPIAVPHVITFRGTAARGAAILEDWFAKCKAAQMAKIIKDPSGCLMVPFAKVFELGGKMEKNEDGQTWYVLNSKEFANADESLIGTGFTWYKTVSKSAHKDVDMSDEKTAPAEVVPF